MTIKRENKMINHLMMKIKRKENKTLIVRMKKNHKRTEGEPIGTRLKVLVLMISPQLKMMASLLWYPRSMAIGEIIYRSKKRLQLKLPLLNNQQKSLSKNQNNKMFPKTLQKQ